jgi:hypothetical protein
MAFAHTVTPPAVTLTFSFDSSIGKTAGTTS